MTLPAALMEPTRGGIVHGMSPLHLTASMRVIKAHEGGRVTIAWAKRRVLDATAETSDPSLLALRGKLERAAVARSPSLRRSPKRGTAWNPPRHRGRAQKPATVPYRFGGKK